jgi:cobalt/nickel transport system permease protein
MLPAGQAAAWYAPAMAFVTAGVIQVRRRLRELAEYRTMLGLMAAFVFVVSLMPMPVPGIGTVSHPCGTPLAAILLGPFAAALVGAVALLLQALFFAHGGITTWGANILSMAVAGSFAGYGVFRLGRRLGLGLGVAAAIAGVVGDLATYGVTSLQLALGLHGQESIPVVWLTAFISFLPTQVPLALVEGVFTAGVVTFVARQQVEVLKGVELRP